MTALYYFSATGNSLTTARILSESLSDCRLIPVASTRKQLKVIENADAVGFVFPVYYGDMPFPVRELISKMVFAENCYVFTVMTCRGHGGAAAQRLSQLLATRGQKLSFCEVIRMPGNSFLSSAEAVEQSLKEQPAAVKQAARRIALREETAIDAASLIPLSKVAYPNNFRGITADEHCIGCGICAQVCPMENIRIENGRAVIGDDCATCLSCFHFCPQEAIWMSRQENIARRSKYCHPDVTLRDILAQKE